MKGIVFNLLERFIVERAGADAYEAILDQCALETKEPFVGPGTYPDRDLVQIATKAAQALGIPLPVAVRAFGHYCLPKLMAMIPPTAGRYDTSKALLIALDSVVHVEVRKLLKGSAPPRFQAIDTGPNTLTLEYRSSRQLCAFLEGLLAGVGDHFGEVVTFTHERCLLRGDDACVLGLTFAAKDAAERKVA